MAELAALHPERPVFRCALAQVHARSGRFAEASELLDGLRDDSFSAVPFDQEWLYGLSLLAEVAVLVQDEDAAAVLLDLLRPWATLVAVDVGEGIRGSVSHHLGTLAAALGRREEAAAHLERSLAENERIGARPWIERTREALERI